MIAILCLIILLLVSVILFLIIKILQQKKLILSYDNCSKLQRNMQRLMFLANLAKTCGHDMIINYSTMRDYTYVSFYKNGWDLKKLTTFSTLINSDETFEEAIKELERLIK
jgi:hypothetical protein